MLKVVGACGRVVGGRLQVQIDLKGDLPGHPFRGNQWTGGVDGVLSSSKLSPKDDKLAKQKAKSLPSRHVEAINYYRGPGAESLNCQLIQGGVGDLDQQQYEEYQKVRSAVDAATIRFEQPTTLYRGLSGENMDEFLDQMEDHKGKSVKMNGFQSFSLNPDVAGRFGDVLIVCKSAAGAVVEPIAMRNRGAGDLGEEEVIHTAGTSYRVMGVEKGNFEVEVGGAKKRNIRAIVYLEQSSW